MSYDYMPENTPLEEYRALRDAPLPELSSLLHERAAILWIIAPHLPKADRRPCRQLASQLARLSGAPDRPPVMGDGLNVEWLTSAGLT